MKYILILSILVTISFSQYDIEGTILDRKWCQCSFLPNPEKAGFIHVRTKITPTGPKREKIQNYNELVSQGIL